MMIDPPAVMIVTGLAVQAAAPASRLVRGLSKRAEQVREALPFTPLPHRRAGDLDALIASID